MVTEFADRREELASAAVVGTGRRPVLDDGRPLSEPETWRAVHLSSQAVRASAGVVQGITVPSPEPGPADTRPAAPDTWSALCRQLISRNRKELLALAVRDLDDHGARLATRDVVPVVSFLAASLTSAHDRSGRASLAAVLGDRGRALVRRHPVWSAQVFGDADSLSADDADELWDTGTVAQRRNLLVGERVTDPDRARTRLASLVGKGSAKERATLLELWEDAPVPEDLPVVEQFVRDRSVSVRNTAGRILLQLPGSSVRTDREAEAADALHHAPDAATRHRLEELVELTDPAEYSRIFGCGTDGVLDARPALSDRVFGAALRHRRFDLVTDLLGGIRAGDLPPWGDVHVPDLPPADQHVLLGGPGTPEDPSVRLRIVMSWSRWAEQSTRNVLDALHQVISDAKKTATRYIVGVDLKEVIDLIAFRAPDVPQVPESLRESAALPQAEGHIANLLLAAALDHSLRSQMAAALHPSATHPTDAHPSTPAPEENS